jgi:hypothetical protein
MTRVFDHRGRRGIVIQFPGFFVQIFWGGPKWGER